MPSKQSGRANASAARKGNSSAKRSNPSTRRSEGMTPKDVIKMMKEQKAVAVDLKFNDFLGIWQHFTVPPSEMDEAVFEEGLGFDGSSIRGWQPIHASDMLVMPDPATAVLDPFTAEPTLS